MKRLLLALFLLPSPAMAQAPALNDIKTVEGHCTRDTQITIEEGRSQTNEDFACDSAVVSYHGQRGSLMIQFSNKNPSRTGDDRLLGFAGTLEGREIMKVERVYLMGDILPLIPTNGFCRLFWKDKKLTGMMCGARIETTTKRIVPVVGFEAR